MQTLQLVVDLILLVTATGSVILCLIMTRTLRRTLADMKATNDATEVAINNLKAALALQEDIVLFLTQASETANEVASTIPEPVQDVPVQRPQRGPIPDVDDIDGPADPRPGTPLGDVNRVLSAREERRRLR